MSKLKSLTSGDSAIEV